MKTLERTINAAKQTNTKIKYNLLDGDNCRSGGQTYGPTLFLTHSEYYFLHRMIFISYTIATAVTETSTMMFMHSKLHATASPV